MGRKTGDSFLVIGVTGGIGAGKSTVSGLLAMAGARIVDADALSHEVTAAGSPILDEIAARLGSNVLTETGALDRSALAGLVFTDPERRKALEAIVHREVVARIDAEIEWLHAAGWQGILVLDVPIPVTRGFVDVCDEVWVVMSPRADRAARVMARSGLSPEQVRARMDAQPQDAFWLELADRVVRNEGSASVLEEAVCSCLQAAREKWLIKGADCAGFVGSGGALCPEAQPAGASMTCENNGPGDTLIPRHGTGTPLPQEETGMKEPMFERDLLYPTDVQFEPGSVHIRVHAPESDGRMPVHVEAKTEHDLLENLESILTVMQADVFDRIRMDIRRSGILFLYPFGGGDTLCVRYAENGRSHTTKVVHED